MPLGFSSTAIVVYCPACYDKRDKVKIVRMDCYLGVKSKLKGDSEPFED